MLTERALEDRRFRGVVQPGASAMSVHVLDGFRREVGLVQGDRLIARAGEWTPGCVRCPASEVAP